jgi:hypothetical protein
VKYPHFEKINTEIHNQNFDFLRYNNDKEHTGEYGKNNKSIMLERKHYCFSFFRMASFGHLSRQGR